MNVDKTKFLLLTGAISAATAVAIATTSGCNTVNETSSDAGNGGDTGTTPPSTDGGGDSATDGGGDAGTACLDDTAPDGGSVDAGDAALPDVCNGTQANGCDITCGDIATKFKAGVTYDIAQCLIKLPSCEGNAQGVGDCVAAALAKTCPDTTADSFCAPLVSACTADGGADAGDGGVVLDTKTCTDLARGLSSNGRDKFQICIDEGVSGNCTLDPAFCINQASFKP